MTIVDALDGITVDLDESLHDDKAQLDLPAGEQTLDGTDALELARTPHAVGDGSDISRMGNQQMVMDAIIDRAESAHVLSRPTGSNSFLDAVTSSLRVDEDLDSVSSLASLVKTVSSVPEEDITFSIMPWAPDPMNTNRVIKSVEADAVFTAMNKDRPLPGQEWSTTVGFRLRRPFKTARLTEPRCEDVLLLGATVQSFEYLCSG